MTIKQEYSNSKSSDSGVVVEEGKEQSLKKRERIFRNTKALEICPGQLNPLTFYKKTIARAINFKESVNLEMHCFFLMVYNVCTYIQLTKS